MKTRSGERTSTAAIPNPTSSSWPPTPIRKASRSRARTSIGPPRATAATSVARTSKAAKQMKNSSPRCRPNIFSIAVNSTHIYWTASTDIGRADLDGADVEPAIHHRAEQHRRHRDRQPASLLDLLHRQLDRSGDPGRDRELDPTFITGAKTPDMLSLSKNATTISGAARRPRRPAGESVIAPASDRRRRRNRPARSPSPSTGPGRNLLRRSARNLHRRRHRQRCPTNPRRSRPSASGTYHWVSSYSGDSINEASATACAAGAFTVKAPPRAVPRARPARRRSPMARPSPRPIQAARCSAPCA